MDPRSESTREELREQFDFLLRVRDRITETHDAVETIHSLREQVEEALARTAAPDARPQGPQNDVQGLARDILDEILALEDELRQRRSKVYQDTENFEPLLDSQFAWVASQTVSADARPTDQAYERLDDLEEQLREHQDRLQRILDGPVGRLNQMLQDAGWEPLEPYER
jgi:phage shock protein A